MNKLLVSDIINLDNGSYNISCKNKKIEININGNVDIYLDNEIINELNINLNDNSILNLYKFNINNNIVINIKQNNNSKLNYNESFINELDSKLIINNYINGNNNESNINIRNIANNNNSKIIVNVKVNKNTFNNIALEDLKGINNGGFIHIEPNIDCLSNEVSANHLTTIGNIDNDLINYLMSKGISISEAKKLLLKGFIFSNMNEYYKRVFGGEYYA